MPKLITGPSNLTPDLRLIQAISEFGAILEGDARAQFNSLKAKAEPKASDVVKLTEELDEKGMQAHSSWRPYGSRLQGILSDIHALTSVGDALVGGSQNMVASGVWAAVRLSLLFSLNFLVIYDRISEMLIRAGRTNAIHKDIVQLFPDDDTLQNMRHEYLIVVVNLCRSFVEYKSKNRLARYVAATFDIDRDLQDSEDRLVTWAKLINDRVQYLHSEVSVKMSKRVSLAHMSQELWSSQWKSQREMNACVELMKYLSPEQDEFDHIWIRERRRGTVKWIFEYETFKAWNEPSIDREPLILVIKGSLGRGKTVLMANIVTHLMQDDKCVVIPFFCQRLTPRTLEFETMMASITHQFVKALKERCRDSKLSTNFSSMNHAKDATSLEKMCSQMIKELSGRGVRQVYLIIDAADELKSNVWTGLCNAVLQWSSSQRVTRGSYVDIKVCVSGRVMPNINIFKKKNSIPLGNQTGNCQADLETFIGNELEQRPGYQGLAKDTQEKIKAIIVTLSEGMFLWASLQIDNLFPRSFDKTILEEEILGIANKCPAQLQQLFEAALFKIPWSCKDQPGIFELVIAAKRPLTLSELIIALRMRSGSTLQDSSDILSYHNPSTSIHMYSGGLLELDEQYHTVHFIHDSVYYYLIDQATPQSSDRERWQFSPVECGRKLARVCLTYLDLPFHRQQLTKGPQYQAVENFSPASIPQSLANSSSLMKLASLTIRKSSSAPAIDLIKLAEQCLENQIKRQKERGGCVDRMEFLAYASNFWLDHSDHFFTILDASLPEDPLSKPFERVLSGQSLAAGKLPAALEPLSRVYITDHDAARACLKWACDHEHMRILFGFLHHAPRKLDIPSLKYNSHEVLLRDVELSIVHPPLINHYIPFLQANWLSGRNTPSLDCSNLVELFFFDYPEVQTMV